MRTHETWSDKAIKLYYILGFNFCRNSIFLRENGKVYQNDYEEGLEVLKLIYDEDFIKQLMETSVL